MTLWDIINCAFLVPLFVAPVVAVWRSHLISKKLRADAAGSLAQAWAAKVMPYREPAAAPGGDGPLHEENERLRAALALIGETTGDPVTKVIAAITQSADPRGRARVVMLAMQHGQAAALARDYREHFHALYRLWPRVVEDGERIRELEERAERLADEAEAHHMATWDDAPLPEDEAIRAAFPTRTGKHELYAEAMRLVGAARSKGKLVALVNWLLSRIEAGKAARR
jgi:hypothetical protein